ncbi:MAG: alanine--tRNA ligase-related protein, partial [Nanoarchaeota archaeon]
IEELSSKKYKGNEKAMRIIADHVKAAVFLIAERINPSNTGQGYVLRRLIRRAIYYGKDIEISNISKIAQIIFKIYPDYPELKENKILETLRLEEEKFNSTIKEAIKKFSCFTKDNPKSVSAKDMFLLFQSFGMPKELIKEELARLNIPFPEKEFEKELQSHISVSGALLTKFKSGLADHSEKTTRLHTATHLLNEALRKVLGKEVKQRGSNITPERLRFDFNFSRKLTEAEIAKIEELVNKKINEAVNVKHEEMPLKQALKSGAQAEFGTKYPEIVSVYSIRDFSKEICTGPHVKNTKDIGRFRIIKEESVAAGIRRIKAIVE